jgi:CRP/FNR family cyclic AMP-dependent transcriptional regulator
MVDTSNKPTNLLSRLPERMREQVIRAMESKVLKSGEVLFRQGTPGDSLVLIERGTLAVHAAKGSGQSKLVAELGPNSVVGEMSCLDPAPRSATVIAATPTVIRKLDRNALKGLSARQPRVGIAVVQAIIEQLNVRIRSTDQSIQDTLEAMGRKNPSKVSEAPRKELVAFTALPFRGKLDLRSVSTLKRLSPSDLEILSVAAPARLYPAKSIMCIEGTKAASCFVLVTGKIDVLRQAQNSYRRLATLVPGALAGQLSLVDTAPRSATLQAQTEVVVLELSRDDFNRLLEAQSPLAIRFQEEVAIAGIRQLRKATQALASLPSFTAVPEPSRKQAEKVAPVERSNEIEDTLAYMQTALKEWGISLKDLDKVRVKKMAGQLSAAEIKARNKI